MAYTSWRGTVGMIKPTRRPGSLEDLIRILPEGIGVIPMFLNIRRGTTEEFEEAWKPYEPLVEMLATEDQVDLIHAEGAPPFMILGPKGEDKLLKKWQRKFKTPVFSSSSNHVAALKALKAKRLIGATYFGGNINKMFADYFEQAGIEVLAMDGIDTPFEQVGELSPEVVYSHVKKSVLRHGKKADAIYLLGSGWRVMPILEMLERDTGLPVVHPVTARSWEIQKRLHIREPVKGYGQLVEDLPALP